MRKIIFEITQTGPDTSQVIVFHGVTSKATPMENALAERAHAIFLSQLDIRGTGAATIKDGDAADARSKAIFRSQIDGSIREAGA